jgi:HEPN domain-containing protein
MRPPAHDEVCFHSQQAAEKFFKALLQGWGLPVPKIHELDDLLTMLLPRDTTLQVVRRGLRRLSRFAVDYRDPGSHANGQKAQTALRRAGRIRLEVRTRLGLRTKS